jgi:hypothetical protein
VKNRNFLSDDLDFTLLADARGGPGGGTGNPGNGGGGGGQGKGQGQGGGSTQKGELYGDQIVLLRDLDPAPDGEDGNGEPVLDTYNDEPQLIAVGYDPLGEVRPGDTDGLFPIYFEMVGEGDYEIPAGMADYVQEVELERANVARAPTRVMDKALDAAVEKLLTADVVQTDAAGRLMYSTDDGETFLTIDAPLENLALYQAFLTAGISGTWTGVQADWDTINTIDGVKDLSFLASVEGFDVASLIAAAWSKEGEITLDALIYENTTLGVNEVSTSGGALTIDYFDFTDGTTETYDYVRSDRYEDTWLRWIEEVVDPDTGEPEPVYVFGTIYDAVFGGEEWDADDDLYLAIDTLANTDPLDDDFIYVDASDAGVNDFAQAADDARAVIEFIHSNQAVEIDFSMVPDEFLFV